MNALFGTEYFGFIAGAYGVVTVCLLSLIVWVVATQIRRERQLAQLQQRGLKRASQTQDKS